MILNKTIESDSSKFQKNLLDQFLLCMLRETEKPIQVHAIIDAKSMK